MATLSPEGVRRVGRSGWAWTKGALGTPDQSNPSNGSAQPVDPDRAWTQTFRAGATGLLTQVDLPIYLEQNRDNPTVPGDLTVTIQEAQSATVHVSNGYDYDDSGTLPVPAGSVFARTNVPASRIVEMPDPGNPPPPLHISFLLPPLLIKGHTYAIVVVSTGTARHNWLVSQTTDVNPYPNGNMLFQFDGSNSEWYNYTYQPYAGAPHISYVEAAFTTFMLPSLPIP